MVQNPIQTSPQPFSQVPAQTVTVQTPPQENKPKTNPLGKIVLIILGFFILAAVGAGAYYLGTKKSTPVTPKKETVVAVPTIQPSPTTDPTTNWKTYSSKDGLFNFKLPQGWVIDKLSDTTKEHFAIQNKKYTSPNDSQVIPDDIVTVSIIEAPIAYFRGYSLTEEEFFDPNGKFWFRGSTGGGSGTTYNLPQQIELAGRKTMLQLSHPTTNFEAVTTDNVTSSYYFYLKTSPPQLVEIQYGINNKNQNKNEDLQSFNQMLNTFKFVDQVINWQTYSGSGFIFQYPATWVTPPNTPNNLQFVWLVDPATGTHTGNGGSILYSDSIQVTHTQSIQTVKTYIDAIQAEQIPALVGQFERKTIVLNGKQTETYHIAGEGTVGWYIPFSDGKQIIDFGPLSTDPSSDSIELQIIKTFKFTE